MNELINKTCYCLNLFGLPQQTTINWEAINNRNLTNLEAGKSKIKVLVNSVSGEALTVEIHLFAMSSCGGRCAQSLGSIHAKDTNFTHGPHDLTERVAGPDQIL